jgi:hypothetical protein
MKAHFRFIGNNKMKADFCFIQNENSRKPKLTAFIELESGVVSAEVEDSECSENIYRESGAIVQSHVGSELPPASEDATSTPQPESSPKTKSISRRIKRSPQEEDISRAIRRWVLPP